MNDLRHIDSVPISGTAFTVFACSRRKWLRIHPDRSPATGWWLAGSHGREHAGADHQALRNVSAVLEAAGSSLARVVKVTVLLARPDLYQEMNEAYAEHFPGPKPARVIARLGADVPGVLVSIDAIALVAASQ
jgi:2-iminobutanoate/2-iminopropanoate deaminase